MPSSSIRAPVGSTPWNGPPQKVPVVRQRTAAWLRAATTSSTSKLLSGTAANSSLKNARISSGTRSSPTGAMFSIAAGRPARDHRVDVACARRRRNSVARDLARARGPRVASLRLPSSRRPVGACRRLLCAGRPSALSHWLSLSLRGSMMRTSLRAAICAAWRSRPGSDEPS